MTKPKNAMVRIEADIKEPLQTLAAADGRSLANYVNRVLQKHVEAQASSKGK